MTGFKAIHILHTIFFIVSIKREKPKLKLPESEIIAVALPLIMSTFEPINPAYQSVFQPNRLSIGLVIPIENYVSNIPTMHEHVERVQLAEKLGFAAVWVRDVPFHVPNFGDAGQMFDPMSYLTFLAAKTTKIGLGVASLALPLHHPVHVLKSANTVESFSNGRLLLGIASGDRAEEYPAMNIDYQQRGEMFREAVKYMTQAQQSFPTFTTKHYGSLGGSIDVLPKLDNQKIPLLITGNSQQSNEWVAENGHGWMSYPRDIFTQQRIIDNWRNLVAQKSHVDKPFMQPLYVDWQDNDDYAPQPIHLGLKTGANALLNYLKQLEQIGVNHVAINLRFNTGNIENTLNQLAEKILSHFHQ